ncbi:MAG: hypothetical protein ABI439_03200 [Rhodospirillales bacterium]
MPFRFIGGVALVLSLAACTHRPPSAVPESAGAHYSGALNAGTPLVTIVRDRNIKPLDPTSKTPLLDQAMAALAKSDPGGRWKGVTYSLSGGNVLSRDWLVQTPLVWGKSARAVGGDGHSDEIVKRIRSLIAGARQSVDITLLQPAPDGAFLYALREGIEALGRSGRTVSVRILIGQYPPNDSDAKKLMASLTDEIPSRGSRLSLYVAAMRSCTGGSDCSSFSWNHAKIVAVDGRVALVGGHNMYAADYLGEDPVFDLSMQLSGPAAADAMRFVDAMWNFVCGNAGKLSTVQVVSVLPGSAAPGSECKPSLAPAGGQSRGGIQVLAVGRLASGITPDFANQSDLARDLMLGAARRSIRIVQQDIGFTLGRPDTLYPESTLEKIADFLLLDGGEVYIVLSNLGAVGKAGNSYSNDVPLESVARKFFDVAQQRSKLDYDTLATLLCRRLHIAPLRFGPDVQWPDGKPIANHAKFWMVDERYFYIGSNNFYPVDLQEYGYIVDSRAAAATMIESYWTPLWRWSKSAAISGDDAPSCVLRQKPVRKSGERKSGN